MEWRPEAESAELSVPLYVKTYAGLGTCSMPDFGAMIADINSDYVLGQAVRHRL
jgi:hypothetical protein